MLGHSVAHLESYSLGHLVGQSVGHSEGHSVNHLVVHSVCHSVCYFCLISHALPCRGPGRNSSLVKNGLGGWMVGGHSCQAEACSLHCGGFSGGGSFVATLDNCRQEFAEKFAQFYKCPSTNSSAGGLHTDETQCDILLGEPLSRIC